MCLLLLERCLADLSVCKNADNSTVFLDTFELAVDRLTRFLSMFLGVFSEGLLLRLVPILIKASLDFVTEMLGPDSSERTQATGSLDVANEADSNHLSECQLIEFRLWWQLSYWWGFDDSDGFDDLLLVHFRTWAIEISDDCSHTSFVSHSSRQMDWFFGVILGKALDLHIELAVIGQTGIETYLAPVSACTLTWQESQRPMTGRFILSVRHVDLCTQ